MAVPPSFSWDVSSERHPGARDEYRDSFAGLYDVSDVELGPGQHFFNRTRMTLFSAGVIGHGRSNTQTLRRPEHQVRRAGLETISIVLAGSPMAGAAGERAFSCAPGSVIFIDHSQASASHWRDLDLTNLIVPREVASRWLAGADLHGVCLAPDNAAARLLAGHLRTLSEVAPDLSDGEGEAAIGAALAIAEGALGGTPASNPDQRAALYRTVRERASRFLDSRVLDPTVTPDTVARACAVSRATLYRAFGEESGLMRHVQERRLDLARKALALRTSRTPTVADIAHAHGFASATHFSRAFRHRFGMSPSDIPRLGEPRGPGSGPGVIRHDAVLDWLNGGASRAEPSTASH